MRYEAVFFDFAGFLLGVMPVYLRAQRCTDYACAIAKVKKMLYEKQHNKNYYQNLRRHAQLLIEKN
ncbi:MAG: hypothetical protein RIS64_536 [Bacteroidota bacterium]|jgi:hypothetical protein